MIRESKSTESSKEASSSKYFLRKRLGPSKDQESKTMVPKAHHVVVDNDPSNNDNEFSHTPGRDNYQTSNFNTSRFKDYSANGSNYNRKTSGNLSADESTAIPLSSSDLDFQIKLNGSYDADSDESDTVSLLPKRKLLKSKYSDHHQMLNSNDPIKNEDGNDSKFESSWRIAVQIIFPFLMAGMGMVAAGIVLDKVQHWDVFERVPEIFILVPALLGLKGNLEMTLASRLSTYANRGLLDDKAKRFTIIWGNIVLVEAQAMVIAFLASLVAMTLGWIPDGKWETNHAIILCAGSLLTGAIASCLLGIVMILVVLLSRKLGVNPDNVATPIAASLGDLITLTLLSFIVKGLFVVLYNPTTAWLGWAIIALFIVLTPIAVWLAHRNEFTREVVRHGWTPVIAAMAISSTGGLILDFAVTINKGIAVFSPVVNGVGGNLVAVQASRISTYLHTTGLPLGVLPSCEHPGCTSPCHVFCAKTNPHAAGSRVMLAAVVPGQLIFLLTIQGLQAGHTTITPQFVAVYVLVSLLQVAILLQICQWLVLRLWRKGIDPDNSAIPYLTALGDLLGTGLLSLGFLFLWLVGDRDADVGD